MEIKLFSCKNVCIFCLVFVQGNNMQKLCRKLAMFPSLRKWAQYWEYSHGRHRHRCSRGHRSHIFKQRIFVAATFCHLEFWDTGNYLHFYIATILNIYLDISTYTDTNTDVSYILYLQGRAIKYCGYVKRPIKIISWKYCPETKESRDTK